MMLLGDAKRRAVALDNYTALPSALEQLSKEPPVAERHIRQTALRVEPIAGVGIRKPASIVLRVNCDRYIR